MKSGMDFGEVLMPAGKYKSFAMEDIPSSYLKWVAENWQDDDIAEAADKEYEWRTSFDKHWEEQQC